MDWSWAVEGVTEETPRTTGPECINYMTNRRRWIESIIFTIIFIYIICWAVKRLKPILLPPPKEIDKPHTVIRLLLLISMTFIFGVEMGYKLSSKSVIFVMNPCHIQTMAQVSNNF
ncbi:transmembrane protein 164-like [Teleopsis dalmanni]|uniref:transmembrane protein 164-like n=1 Tax=Teleopsis dalmanni TaxID=139649 RepID=UPI0018CEE72C|nr:transmembrane protein 164-like [Teleopsis dalmanni]